MFGEFKVEISQSQRKYKQKIWHKIITKVKAIPNIWS